MTLQHFQYTEQSPGSQLPYNPLPAVVIGGPPHSGKSVLTYSLTRALRLRDVPHYALRAYPPDYEGDWFHMGDREWVRHLRLKGARSEAWLPQLRRDIAQRHLPLIVDLGGVPTPEQETLLDACTHSLLLTPDAAARVAWDARFARHGLVLLADLHSELHGQNRLAAHMPVLRGTLAGLERGQLAGGPAFDALVARLAQLFTTAAPDLPRRHLEGAPVELAVNLNRLAQRLGLKDRVWEPADLAAVLDYLPSGVPLGLYGRGPNWLYAAVAVHALPAPLHLFDVRLGWVAAPLLRAGPWPAGGPVEVVSRDLPQGTLLDFRLLDAYLDIADVEGLSVPRAAAPVDSGVILGGRLPLWLWAALPRICDAPWVAVLYPPLHGAVVVATRDAAFEVGQVIAIPEYGIHPSAP